MNRSSILLALSLPVAIAMRVVVAIGYVADPDSLRFALAVDSFDIVALQPHFPGYPVFVWLTQLLDAIGLTLPTTFAVIGGFASWGLLVAFLRLVNTRIDSPGGLIATLLILFNPMVAVMATRYMPDLLGAAIALWIVVLTVRTRIPSPRDQLLAALLIGLLAGIRLSYLPLVALPYVTMIVRTRRPVPTLAATLAALLLWLLPVVAMTGYDELVGAAERQTQGHFEEFGGTIETEPDLSKRRTATIRGLVVDGFGGYYDPEFNIEGFVAPLLSLLMIVMLGLGIWKLLDRDTPGLLVVSISIVVYLIWVILFQNVIYQPRHFLPVIPLLLAPIWAGTVVAAERRRLWLILVLGTLTLYGATGIDIAVEARQPTAIAQAADYLRKKGSDELLLSSPLVCTMLRQTGVETECLSSLPNRSSASRRVLALTGPEQLPGFRVDTMFTHDPRTNRIWSELRLQVREEM